MGSVVMPPHTRCRGCWVCGAHAGPLLYVWFYFGVYKVPPEDPNGTDENGDLLSSTRFSLENHSSASESSVRCHFIEKKMFLKGFCVHNNLSLKKSAQRRQIVDFVE